MPKLFSQGQRTPLLHLTIRLKHIQHLLSSQSSSMGQIFWVFCINLRETLLCPELGTDIGKWKEAEGPQLTEVCRGLADHFTTKARQVNDTQTSFQAGVQAIQKKDSTYIQCHSRSAKRKKKKNSSEKHCFYFATDPNMLLEKKKKLCGKGSNNLNQIIWFISYTL